MIKFVKKNICKKPSAVGVTSFTIMGQVSTTIDFECKTVRMNLEPSYKSLTFYIFFVIVNNFREYIASVQFTGF